MQQRITLESLQPMVRAIAHRQAYTSFGRLHVDDLTQVGMMAVHTVLLQADAFDEAHLRSRAGAAARNAMIDLARVETRCRRNAGASAQAIRNPEQLDEVRAAGLADPAPGPEEQLLWRQMALLLVEAVSSLPQRQQDVLRLTYENEATQIEVAAMWGLTPSRVSQIHTEALDNLRRALMPAAPPDPQPPVHDIFASDIVRGDMSRLFVSSED